MEKIACLSAALEDTRCLVHERNTQIKALKKDIHSLQQIIEVMELELIDLCEFTNEEHIQHESDIAELEEKVKQLQDKCKLTQSPHFHLGHIPLKLGSSITHYLVCVLHQDRSNLWYKMLSAIYSLHLSIMFVYQATLAPPT